VVVLLRLRDQPGEFHRMPPAELDGVMLTECQPQTKSGGGGEKSTPIDRVALESVKIVVQA
jgi:hypothetical protein